MSDRVDVTKKTTNVTVRGGCARVITLDRRTVAEIERNRPRPVHVRQSTPVVVQDRHTQIQAGGGMGLQGPPGQPGGSIAPIEFAWGDAARVVFTAPSSGLLSICRLDITTPFNGAGASITVGTTSLPEAVMPAAYNDPSAIAKYQRTADFRMSAGDELNLVIAPGFSPSAGAGTLILEFLPD